MLGMIIKQGIIDVDFVMDEYIDDTVRSIKASVEAHNEMYTDSGVCSSDESYYYAHQ